MKNTFHYDIKNYEIVKILLNQGFTISNTSPDVWQVEAPSYLTASKARKIISASIKFYQATKKFSKAKKTYESFCNQIITSDLSR